MPLCTVLLVGRTGLEAKDIKFGTRVGMVPARRVHEAVKHLLDLYKTDRQGSERFAFWTDRRGADYFKKELDPFQNIDAHKADPKILEDLGDEGHQFKVQVGKGECAA